MKVGSSHWVLCCAATFACGGGANGGGATGAAAVPPTSAPGADGASVLQHHKHASRDGLYVEPALTRAAAAGLHRDVTFNASIQGPTYAQPLYLEASPGGRDVVIAATEQNRVYALDAGNGSIVWERQLGSPAPQGGSGICGNVNPLGITGTPAIDAASRTLYLDAMTIPSGASSRKHLIFALSLDDGSTRPGWPVDVSTLQSGAISFNAPFENQRGALLLTIDSRTVLAQCRPNPARVGRSSARAAPESQWYAACLSEARNALPVTH